ncbi:unnamed protein product [Albugo candida]|uniref:tryptophan synthase n=1 Tax=Albugo candida TaxID=65357 RepID=A0A024GLV5_9STRA|nr:unnamed protein product [Albugo candida]|eukprot:CCI47855.1 unnamed protein product [Albugo candida]
MIYDWSLNADDSAKLPLNKFWLSGIDRLALFNLLTFKFSSKQLGSHSAMCTRQSQLLLVLVQVMIYSGNVNGECFIRDLTKCSFNPSDRTIFKHMYKIKLDKNDKARKYYCKESFAIGDRKEVDLSGSGDSSSCDKFQYSFEDHELIFYQAPVEYPPVFTVKVVNSERWQLGINAIHLSDGRACNHDGGFFLALGKKTKLLVPLTGVLEPVDGVNEFLITSNSETIKLNVPTETVQAGNEWVLIIGEDLHKSVHIDIKKDEDRTQPDNHPSDRYLRVSNAPPVYSSVSELHAYFGAFGGCFVAETLVQAHHKLAQEYVRASQDASFRETLEKLGRDYIGRPTPLYFADRLTKHCYGAQIWLKREDLAHTGAHKINNAIGQAVLAKRLGKQRIIAETGAGQHGVATATACALLGLDCTVYMGYRDTQVGSFAFLSTLSSVTVNA